VKIAVTSTGKTPDSPVDPRFGRAAYFVLFDSDAGTFEAHDNAQNLNAPQGAGIQAGETVARLGAKALVTGHCGPKAFRVLKAAGIRVVVGAQGTAKEAMDRFLKGELKDAEDADVQGHWA
jgi:predicted Fe-Mo cluster-binding NifX family protein